MIGFLTRTLQVLIKIPMAMGDCPNINIQKNVTTSEIQIKNASDSDNDGLELLSNEKEIHSSSDFDCEYRKFQTLFIYRIRYDHI
jgi:hypothetical protein